VEHQLPSAKQKSFSTCESVGEERREAILRFAADIGN
jgi:hypothetical protein